MRKLLFLVIIILLITVLWTAYVFFNPSINSPIAPVNITFSSSTPSPILPSPSPTITLSTLPQKKILENDYHIFQTFNNCGPAALSMALSYYEIFESQQKLGLDLRPYQNPKGDNDDKSVTLEELAQKAKEYDLIPYHRPNGNTKLIKYFITYDIPVIARTLTKVSEDIGHYRIVKGFDDITGQIIQDDSLQNKNLRFSYQQFNLLWKRFNYEYLILVPKDKQIIAQVILAEDKDDKIAWEKAALGASRELEIDQNDVYSRFNLSVALYRTGSYQQAVEEFEKIEGKLPFRTLWYQIEPIKAYFELGNYQRVFEITDRVLNNYNRAFSELYILRGEIYLQQGNPTSAKEEFEKAVFYNINLKPAQESLNSLTEAD